MKEKINRILEFVNGSTQKRKAVIHYSDKGEILKVYELKNSDNFEALTFVNNGAISMKNDLIRLKYFDWRKKNFEKIIFVDSPSEYIRSIFSLNKN